MASFGGLEVVWIQPLDDRGAFADFLARHGSGIMSLNHRVPSLEALEREIVRMAAVGVPVLQRSAVETDSGVLTVVHLDTEAGGKYVLGLVHGTIPTGDTPPPAPPDLKLSQFAFVAKDLEAASSSGGSWASPPSR